MIEAQQVKLFCLGMWEKIEWSHFIRVLKDLQRTRVIRRRISFLSGRSCGAKKHSAVGRAGGSVLLPEPCEQVWQASLRPSRVQQ